MNKVVAQLRHEHMVRFIASFQRQDKGQPAYCLLHEWADGGNLHDFWYTHSPILSESLVEEAVGQFLGLAKALCAIHYPEMEVPYSCHGNLRPGKILRFQGNGVIGTLKIGGWGHRKLKTPTTGISISKGGHAPLDHVLYEPPEGRERIYSHFGDIWAMGCIIFEFMIWLLEGVHGLERFHSVLFSLSGPTQYYYATVQRIVGKEEVELNDLVTEEMDRIKSHPACEEGALHELLDLVRGRLLVIDLPVSLGRQEKDEEKPCRARTTELVATLENIFKGAKGG